MTDDRRLTTEQAMAQAITLAWQGWGRVAPNPLVGAVVLRDGQVIGEGYHAEYGDRHAEAVALAAAGEGARGATLVVTLEPCAHQGKQPPCTDLVRRAGISRVVAAVADPNAVAAGGAEYLRQHGVEVEIGLMQREAAAQNAAFLHAHGARRRPYVALKLATSLDACIADREGRSRWISGPEARAWVQWLRAGFDALAVGGTTARADDPSLTVRGAVVPRRVPRRVVFGRSSQLSSEAALARTARETPTTVFVAPGTGAAQGALATAGVDVRETKSLAAALATLRDEAIESVLVEGGGQLAGALLAEDLVDRLYWVQSPLWLGDGIPAVTGLPGTSLELTPRWRVVERRALGEDTLLVVDRR
jgi:diaminohydroxyphosphoribosylaminopyrimidine deaminase/5-amino-6-(5-phosphoribosylamino)uracil reductase